MLAEIVKSIDQINDTFGPDTTISINVAAKQAGNPEFMRPFAEAIEATGFEALHDRDDRGRCHQDAFSGRNPADLPKTRRRHFHRRFGIGYSSLSALADITADEITSIAPSSPTSTSARAARVSILRARSNP